MNTEVKDEILIKNLDNEDNFEYSLNEARLKYNSYLTKNEFIKLIEQIDFDKIQSCEIRCITGIIFDGKDLSCKLLTKNINID